MTLMLTIKADVDLEEVHRHLAAGVRDDVAAQKDRMKRLEAQRETMNRQQSGHSSGQAPASPPIGISAEDLQTLQTQAVQGNAKAQSAIGFLYYDGNGVPQDFVRAVMWWSLAAAHPTDKVQNDAAYNRDEVARRMTPAQIAEVQQLVQQCQAQQFKGC